MPWWGWLAWVLAIILGIVAYTHLPAQVVGNTNRMTPRLLIVLYDPAIMLGIILLWHVLWRIDPKKTNYESFWSTYRQRISKFANYFDLMLMSLCIIIST